MNNINNMGGILFAEILNTDEIALFAVHQNQACIRSKEGHDWYPLPTRESLKLQLSLPMILKTQESHISIQRPSSFPDPH